MTNTQFRQVQDVLVDFKSIRELAHRCVPTNCAHRQSCCATYEVPVDSDRVSTIVGTVHDAARFAPQLLEGDEVVDLFDEIEGGLCLNTDEAGQCLFAFQNQDDAPLCSLHAVALDMNLPPASVKPKACALWPLALSEGHPPLLGVQPGALDFACNRPRTDAEQSRGTLDPEVAELILGVFGESFITELLDALATE